MEALLVIFARGSFGQGVVKIPAQLSNSPHLAGGIVRFPPTRLRTGGLARDRTKRREQIGRFVQGLKSVASTLRNSGRAGTRLSTVPPTVREGRLRRGRWLRGRRAAGH